MGFTITWGSSACWGRELDDMHVFRWLGGLNGVGLWMWVNSKLGELSVVWP